MLCFFSSTIELTILSILPRRGCEPCIIQFHNDRFYTKGDTIDEAQSHRQVSQILRQQRLGVIYAQLSFGKNVYLNRPLPNLSPNDR